MSDETINIDLVIKTADSAKSVGDIRKQIKELDSAALNIGEGGKGFSDLAKKSAELQDKLDGLKDSTNSLKGSGIEKLNSSLGLLKEGFINADPEKLGTAFKVMGAAMAAIPIFLLIEGLKILWENLDKVIGFLNGSTEALKAAQTQYENTTRVATLLADELRREIKLLEAQGKNTEILLSKKTELYFTELKLIEASYRNNQTKLNDIKANDSLYESYLRLQAGVARFLGNTVEAEAFEKTIIINKQERSKELLDIQTNLERDLGNLVNEAQVEGANREKESFSKQKENTTKHNSELLKIKEDRIKLESNLAAAALAEQIKNDADELKSTNDLIEKVKILKQNEELRLAANNEARLLIKKERDLAEIESEYQKTNLGIEAQQAKADALLVIESKFNDDVNNIRTITSEKKAAQDQKDLDDSKKIAEDTRDGQLQVAQSTFDSLQGLSDLFFEIKKANTRKGSAEELKAAKSQFKINKALSLSTAIISGIQGTIAAFSSGAAVPVVGAVLGPLYAVAAGAAAAANIAKISKTQFEGGGGGGASVSSSVGGGITTPTPGGFSAQSLQPVGGGQNSPQTQSPGQTNVTGAQRVYVVSSDLTNQQNADQVLERRATFTE